MNPTKFLTKTEKRDNYQWMKKKIQDKNAEIVKINDYLDAVEFLREINKEPDDSFLKWLFIESKLEPTPVFSVKRRFWFPVLSIPRKVRFRFGRRRKKVKRDS